MTKAPSGAPRDFYQTIKPYYDQTFSFPILDITKLQNIFQIHGYYDSCKIFQILAYQTFFVKPCYNNLMGRNYFSKHGGPYFKNDGFSQHSHSHDDPHDIKPDHASIFIAIGFVTMTVSLLIVTILL